MIRILALTAALALLSFPTFAQSRKQPGIGIVQGLSGDSVAHKAGYQQLVESASRLLSPKTVNDAQFQQNRAAIRKLRTPLYAYNIFMPGELKLVGPALDEAAVLAYADVVFQRCRETGVKMIVWGSGGARRVPEGFDVAQAKIQFIGLARKVSALAVKYGITLALENLNHTETNFITTVAEALDVVQKVDAPNFRLCADIYHMLVENEPADILEKTAPYLIHCDIAEKDDRTPPGVHGDDFRPYLKALKNINYKGKIILECRWEDFGTQARPAYQYLKQQLDEVYSGRP